MRLTGPALLPDRYGHHHMAIAQLCLPQNACMLSAYCHKGEIAMELSIEDTGRPCPKCALPMKYFTLTRDPDYLPPITLVGCPTCGVPDWRVETEIEQPTKSRAAR